jgi:hypothetical protein
MITKYLAPRVRKRDIAKNNKTYKQTGNSIIVAEEIIIVMWDMK